MVSFYLIQKDQPLCRSLKLVDLTVDNTVGVSDSDVHEVCNVRVLKQIGD